MTDNRRRSGECPEIHGPTEWIRGHLEALDQRSVHIGFGDKRINDQSCVVRIDRTEELPVSCPRVYFNFSKTRADTFHSSRTLAIAAAASDRLDRGFVGLHRVPQM
jgi:hypothetical protein